MRKILVLATSAIVIAAFATPSQAIGHRDAAAKARGDMGSFWSSNAVRFRGVPTVSVGSNPAGMQSYRSFSYVPAAPQQADVTQEPAEAVQTPAQPAQAPVVQERRSFSYQPAPAGSQSYRTVKKQAWQYPKTDPRRYQQ